MAEQKLTAELPGKKRKIHIEIMRIAAIIAVIFNHTNQMGYALFSLYEPGSFSFWLYLAHSVFCKFAVPLFFLISGALMLGRPQESIRKTFVNRVLKYVLILTAISGFYALAHHIMYGNTYTAESFFKSLYTSNLKYHLGFLYSYIAFLLMLPLLRAFVRGMEDRHFLYLMLLYFCIRMLPVAQYLLWKGQISLNSNIYPSLSFYGLVVPMAGYFLENRVPAEKIRKNLWWVWLLNLACIALTCWATYVKGVDTGEFSEGASQSFFENFSWVNAVTVYMTIKCLFSGVHFGKRMEKGIILLGGSTFGIYLYHPLFKNLFDMRALEKLKTVPIPCIFRAWVYVGFMLVSSFLFTLILKQLTGLVRKTVKGRRAGKEN